MDWIERLTDATVRFGTELERGDLTGPVRTCPGWTLADLGEHLRSTHLWAAHAVLEGDPDGTPAPGQLDRDSLTTGYRAAAKHLIDVLGRTPEDAPAWAFGPGPRVAGFWRRRQVHETTMHLYDALTVSGRESAWPIDADLAWDGVDEVAQVFYRRQVRLGRTEPLPGTLLVTPTDLAVDSIALGDGAPTVELRDSAAAGLLTLWGRLDAPADAAALLSASEVTP